MKTIQRLSEIGLDREALIRRSANPAVLKALAYHDDLVARNILGSVIRTALITDENNQDLRLVLRIDRDGYRWYQEGGADSEVSGNTEEDACEQAHAAWRDWNLRWED